MKKLYFLTFIIFSSAVVNAQIIDFPDPLFKAKLLTTNPNISPVGFDQFGNYLTIDSNSDGEIEVPEALEVYRMIIDAGDIANLSGIEYFTNLTNLEIYDNPIAALDISTMTMLSLLRCHDTNIQNLIAPTSLVELHCSSNQLTSLDLSGCTNLTVLNCGYNQIGTLNVASLLSLVSLNCQNNQIAVLDVSNLSLLQSIDCSHNSISVLDTTNKSHMYSLECSYNNLTDLNLTGMGASVNPGNPVTINCLYNNLSELNVSVIAAGLEPHVNCGYNPDLSTVYIKNGIVFSETLGRRSSGTSSTPPPLPGPGIQFEGCPGMQYLCTDDFNFGYIQQKIDQYGYSGCLVNDYCTFVPGGNYFVVQGSNRFDSDNNGCDASDLLFPGLKYAITDENSTRTYFFDANGNYNVASHAGISTIVPIFENPDYFTVSPVSVTVDFPTDATPFQQNFCLSPNGIHPDLEVGIISLNAARPGFDANYKIVFTNKGNAIQNGAVALAFDDAVMDLATSNPAVSASTANLLSWNFTAMQPFESREITLTFNINSPTETPPVVAGNILLYNISVSGTDSDSTPEDNDFTLSQTVVNSQDPNDKTCLEGNTVGAETIGQYVHYVIRFENTGTFAAENIVVKDMIDTSKFDVATLIPLTASHPFTTRISAGNKAEFIFENINLPFDDANNDGYVAFKIKTKPTLVVGDTFSNTASIYFDYNFPIVTNTATTAIEVLGNADFEFSQYFALYPNPAKNVLNIQAKEAVVIKTINIYNVLGQLVLAIPNAENLSSVDVSDLKSGNYFIKIISDEGISGAKFIKE